MKICENCEKDGLPILLCRYGTTPRSTLDGLASGGASLRGNHPVTNPSAQAGQVPLPDTTGLEYTIRTLRSGYVHVYYESEDRWEAYAVDEKARLLPVPAIDYPPRLFDYHPNCMTEPRKAANASLLTISYPKTAGNIWIAFSDVWWTNAVREKNGSEETRRKHMRVLDASAWMQCPTPEGSLQPIARLRNVVVDYHPSPRDAMRTLASVSKVGSVEVDYDPLGGGVIPSGHVPFSHPDTPDAIALLRESERLSPGRGLIMVLDDPVGLVQEISAFNEASWEHFLSSPDAKDPVHPKASFRRKNTLVANLGILEQQVCRQAEGKLYEGAQWRRYRDRAGPVPYFDGPFGAGIMLLDEDTDEVLSDDDVTSGDIERACTAEWAKYRALFDEKQMAQYKRHFQEASSLHDSTVTALLASAHAEWMQSPVMRAVLDLHYDDTDIDSGMAFAATFYSCIEGTGGLGACLNLYNAWLKLPLAESPLWRSLLHNHVELLDLIQPIAAPKLPMSGPDDWTNFFEVYKRVMGMVRFRGKSLPTYLASADMLPALLNELAVPISQSMAPGSASASAMLTTLGMRAETPLTVVETLGTFEDHVKELGKVLLQTSGAQKVKGAPLQREIAAQLRSIAREGFPVGSEVRFSAITIDHDAAARAAHSGVPKSKRPAMLAKAVKTADISKRPIIPVNVYADSVLGRVLNTGRVPGVLASVSCLLGMWSLNNARSELASALKGQHARAWLKFDAMITGLCAALVEITTLGLRWLSGSVAFASRALSSRLFRWVSKIGGFLGGLSLVMLGTADALTSIEAFNRGQLALGIMAFANAVLQFSIVIGLVYGLIAGATVVVFASPILLAVYACIFVFGIAIDLLKEPKTMSWLRQTIWSVGRERGRYSEDEEYVDFYKALEV